MKRNGLLCGVLGIGFCLLNTHSIRAEDLHARIRDGQAQLERAGDNVRRSRSVRQHALETLQRARTDAETDAAATFLRTVLEHLADLEEPLTLHQLTLRLQAAGTYGVQGRTAEMDARITQLLAEAADLDVVTRMDAVGHAATFYVHNPRYPVARHFQTLRDDLYETVKVRNSYACAFVETAPIGVGGWMHSEILNDPEKRESRFRDYPLSGQGYALISDVATAEDRPAEVIDDAAQDERETSFYMVYDKRGWHVFVESFEPNVEQVMLEDGRGRSTLEIFFSPGLSGVSYYQFICNLASGEVQFYDWNSPHRGYRRLPQGSGGVEVQTAPLENRWVTSIFVPWHLLHDRIPFVTGQDSTWRFTLIRFGPVRKTWGGRVHETGTWGKIHFSPMPEDARIALMRDRVRHAWWRYASTRDEATEFWSCPRRGDPAFFEAVLLPEIERHDGYAQRIGAIGEWSVEELLSAVRDLAPVWMEFAYEVQTLRANTLMQRLTDF